MRQITIDNTLKRDFHQFMLGGITPRPIALVSTIDAKGNRNLAPFSYFNAVSSLPPILMVSIGRKADGSKKDTLVNIEETGEFVVNMVHFPLVMQMALSSVQLPPDADEFDLAGLNTMDSSFVKAFRVKESPIHFECKVRDILELGSMPGESTLVFGDVQCIHVEEEIIDKNNRINPSELKIVGRLGRSYYTRTGPETLETIVMPQQDIPIGFEALPDEIKTSEHLSANDIAKLASCKRIPDEDSIKELKDFLKKDPSGDSKQQMHQKIKEFIHLGNLDDALVWAFTLNWEDE